MNKYEIWFWIWTIGLIINLFNAFDSGGWGRALSIIMITWSIMAMMYNLIKRNEEE